LAGREIASHISYESDTEISIFLPTQKQWKYQHILSHFFPPFTYLYMVSWGKRETGTGCQTETKSVVSSGRGRKSRPALQGKRERFSRQRDGGEPGVRFRAQRPSPRARVRARRSAQQLTRAVLVLFCRRDREASGPAGASAPGPGRGCRCRRSDRARRQAGRRGCGRT
jgi:hypothetical protein